MLAICCAAAQPASGLAVGELPRASNGRVRFYVESEPEQPAGGTIARRLTIFERDGGRPTELLVKDYQISLDTPGAIRLDGDLLRVPTKESFKALSASGISPDPIGEIDIRIDGDRVVDLGHHARDTELAFADELFDRVQRHQSAADLAAPAVIAALARDLRETDSLGQLGNWHVERNKAGSTLCLPLIDGPGPYELTLVRRRGSLFCRSLARKATCSGHP